MASHFHRRDSNVRAAYSFKHDQVYTHMYRVNAPTYICIFSFTTPLHIRFDQHKRTYTFTEADVDSRNLIYAKMELEKKMTQVITTPLLRIFFTNNNNNNNEEKHSI